MRERPILFSGPMVRAILVGHKTQTRRVVKHVDPDGCVWKSAARLSGVHNLEGKFPESAMEWCPYGQPGDRLWVRETWSQPTTLDPGPTFYRADYPACVPPEFTNVPPVEAITWKPSIHMPRSACRLVLEITSVRVERLQAISYEDALAEGAFDPRLFVGDEWDDADGESADELARRLQWPQRAFRELWCGINGAESWDANPWVWVVEFRRADTDKKEM
ncbi:ASCH domain-containing protein [Achromobacter xylosoxidans]|uniref:hypothetical protein n=1 Tax=Alcaligenes xylosoxydans xylosoxydans TaxID=85698 RepID=UPI0006C56451|nr:hypothetical protein [Achromobacter xylosoxidans]MCH4575704.1 hypothetical protein [Achromobacter xylosoxidans]NEV03895.1 hypothetical protein [Achromobacter xylosoxidans]OMG83629.1 hypothetical protein BIZ53_28140 [Achromobacter xylosoxidans]PNL98362.1 hypothetical protein A6J83_024955 [Achromobacter xylosoxidans]CUK23334.1 Uncharacterised protein [Achromobacter xylosoxidans]